MKTDYYTKTVLTVIAICLTIIVFKQLEIIPNANANPKNPVLKGEMNYGLVPLNADGSIDVNIKSSSSAMEVNISEISTSDKLNVKVKEVDSYAFSYCTVPVKNE